MTKAAFNQSQWTAEDESINMGNDEVQNVNMDESATASAAREVLEGKSTRRGFARVLPFLCPAFISSIAYMDPGNFATNIQGGAQFGYLLVWVVLASNLMAMLVQALSAKLGIATGTSLPEMIRREFPAPVTWALWAIAE